MTRLWVAMVAAMVAHFALSLYAVVTRPEGLAWVALVIASAVLALVIVIAHAREESR